MNYLDIHYLNIDVNEVFQGHLKELLKLSITANGSQGVYFFFYSSKEDAFILKDSYTVKKTSLNPIIQHHKEIFTRMYDPEFDGRVYKYDKHIQKFYLDNFEIPRSLILSPIRLNHAVIGFLLQEHEQENYFSDHELQVSGHIGKLVNMLLSNSNTLDRLKERGDRLSVLLDVASILSMVTTREEFLTEISAHRKDFLQFDRAVLTMREEFEHYFKIDAVSGESDWLKEGMMFHLNETLVSKAIVSGTPQYLENVQKTKWTGVYKPGDLDLYQFQAVVALPLGSDENSGGALVLEFTEKKDFFADDINVLSMIAMNLGASIRRLFLFEKLSEIATIDPLTDILNLRALNDRLTNELSRSSRYEMPLTMMFLDLDKFKSINDNYGHLMGDEVIRETAKIIKENLRDADILGRYGGEEFIAVLTNTPLKSGRIVAGRIVKALDKKIFEYGGQTVKCKISIGIAQFPEHGKTITDLIETADAAMYEAKSRGGNQVVLYQGT